MKFCRYTRPDHRRPLTAPKTRYTFGATWTTAAVLRLLLRCPALTLGPIGVVSQGAQHPRSAATRAWLVRRSGYAPAARRDRPKQTSPRRSQRYHNSTRPPIVRFVIDGFNDLLLESS
jgi:hypothetical protein